MTEHEYKAGERVLVRMTIVSHNPDSPIYWAQLDGCIGHIVISASDVHTLREHDCEKELEQKYPSNAQAEDGELWTCSCGKVWSHICDEAEGCAWWPVRPQPSKTLLENATVLEVLQKYAPQAVRLLGLQTISQITNALNEQLLRDAALAAQGGKDD